jgi:hypothetical protein
LPEEQQDGSLAFSTKESYRLNLREWVIPRWGTSPLCDIKAPMVEEWLKTLKRTEAREKTPFRFISRLAQRKKSAI